MTDIENRPQSELVRPLDSPLQELTADSKAAKVRVREQPRHLREALAAPLRGLGAGRETVSRAGAFGV